MVAVTELVERLGVISALDAAVGPIKQRDRGFGAGELLVGLATAQCAEEDFLVGLDRQRADVVGQEIAPVPGLSSTTAAGLARRLTGPQWTAVGVGVARVTAMLPELRICGGRSTGVPPSQGPPAPAGDSDSLCVRFSRFSTMPLHGPFVQFAPQGNGGHIGPLVRLVVAIQVDQ